MRQAQEVNGFKVGDKVRYSSQFLRSIADYSKSSADMRGHIEAIVDYAGIYIAIVDGDWNGASCNLVNLSLDRTKRKG